MKRRSLLSSILAAGMAPAIVKASSIMPIWVPSNKLVVYPVFGADMGRGDFTVEGWIKNDEWQHFAKVVKDGRRYVYINGVLQPSFPVSALRITED